MTLVGKVLRLTEYFNPAELSKLIIELVKRLEHATEPDEKMEES